LDGAPRDASTLSQSEREDWLEDTHSAMCLATWKRDRWLSLEADRREGILITRPLKVGNPRLTLNLQAPQGSAQIELLDHKRNPLPGFTGTAHGDGFNVPVSWNNTPASLPEGESVRFRIRLRNAHLFGSSELNTRNHNGY